MVLSHTSDCVDTTAGEVAAVVTVMMSLSAVAQVIVTVLLVVLRNKADDKLLHLVILILLFNPRPERNVTYGKVRLRRSYPYLSSVKT